MRYKRCGSKIIVRIDKGEEIVESLKKICQQVPIKLGTITGIGATNNIIIVLLNTKTKKYESKQFTGDHEIAPLHGNITTMNGEVYLHLHVNICNADHQSFGGHLSKSIVSATFEGVIDIIDGDVERVFDQHSGINLLNI
jgi:predicted DNA-binding protein with PD1-like motif